MWIDKALPYGADILLSAYAVYCILRLNSAFFSEIQST